MRTSNIILISSFLATICIMGFIHAVVYNKEKHNEIENGSFYRLREEKEKYMTTVLKPFSHINIEGVYNVYFAYAPEYSILIKNTEKNKIQFNQKDSVLNIHQYYNDNMGHRNAYLYANTVNMDKYAIVYLPSFSNITINNGSTIIDSFPTQNIPLINLIGNNGNFIMGQSVDIEDLQLRGKIKFNHINVQLDSFSSFNTQSNFQFKQVNLKASNMSIIRFKGSEIDSLNLKLGDSCKLEIPNSLLRKAKLTQ